MRCALPTICLLVFGLFLGSSSALAEKGSDRVLGGLNAIRVKSGYDNVSVSVVVGEAIKMVLGLVGVIFLVLVVYGGFLWLTSAGEEKKTTEAMNLISHSVVGLVITLSAYAVTVFVINSLYAIR